MSLLSHVLNLTPTVTNAIGAPSRFANRGLNFLEDRTYQHLARNNPAQAESLAQSIYDKKNVSGWQTTPAVLTRDSVNAARENSGSIMNAIYDNELARLNDRARTQARIAPGVLRLAGQVAPYIAVGAGARAVYGMQDRRQDQEDLDRKYIALREIGLSDRELQEAAVAMGVYPDVELIPEQENKKVLPANPLVSPGQFFADIDHNARLY